MKWEDDRITVSRAMDKKLQGVDVDCGDIPDAAMTLAVAALFAEGKTTIRNVYNWRVKETERMVAIVTELRKLGATVEEGIDYCVIEPPKVSISTKTEQRWISFCLCIFLAAYLNRKWSLIFQALNETSIDTYDDHRMAMAFSLAACGDVPVIINDPKCTAKTFPTYFEELDKLIS